MIVKSKHPVVTVKMPNTQVRVWVVAYGNFDFLSLDIANIKSRLHSFEFTPNAFLAGGIKGHSSTPLIEQDWFRQYEAGVQITLLVEGSGLYGISNMNANDGFLYLKTIKQKNTQHYDFLRAFIVMSMTATNRELDDVRDSIVQGIQKAGLNVGIPDINCSRIDDERGATYKIDSAIFRALEICGIVVCDLTEGKPNCYFELAWAIAHKRHVIITAKKGTTIHFDVAGYNVCFWESQRNLKDAVERNAEAILMKHYKR